jgi:tellurite resistance protein TerA
MAVLLSKDTPRISLAKKDERGTIRFNLNWRSNLKRGLFSKPQPVDLDLACLYEFTDGRKGVVQALGNSFTASHQGQRVIWLDGDDRSGESADGENLLIDLAHASQIKRILAFAYIYEGSANFADAQGVATIYPQRGEEVVIHLDQPDPAAKSCAIALIDSVGGELMVNREVRYIRGMQSAVDEAYRWGMRWTPGRK